MRIYKKILRKAKQAAKALSIALLLAGLIGLCNGWTLKIGPEGLLVYKGMPYRAYMLKWGDGIYEVYPGKWANRWIWPMWLHLKWK